MAENTGTLDAVTRAEILKDLRSQRVRGPTRVKSQIETTEISSIDIKIDDQNPEDEPEPEPEAKMFLPSMLKNQKQGMFLGKLDSALNKQKFAMPNDMRPISMDVLLRKSVIPPEENDAAATDQVDLSQPKFEKLSFNNDHNDNLENKNRLSTENIKPTFIMKEVKELKSQEFKIGINPFVTQEIKENNQKVGDNGNGSNINNDKSMVLRDLKKSLVDIGQTVQALDVTMRRLKQELATVFTRVSELEDQINL